MVDRLAKMESVVKEFSRSKVSTPPSTEFRPGTDSHAVPRSERTRLGASSELVFEEDAPMSVNGHSTPAEFEPHLNHNAPLSADNSNDIDGEDAGITLNPANIHGSFSIFSLQGIKWINELVGDDSFGRAVSTLTPSPQNSCNAGLSPIHPLPSRSVTIDHVNEYLTVLNRHVRLFDDQEIMDGVEKYYSTGISPSRSWFAATNIILAHTVRKRSGMENSVDCEKYIGNAMSMIPSIMMSKPDLLNAGAMLSMAGYFIFLSEHQTAIMILAAAIQLMVLSGYDTPRRRPGQTEKDKLGERRLFWQAFIFDHDLALRVGKPPMIGPDFVIDLPNSLPEDGAGTVTFDNGITLNIFREHVRLALIKSKVYSLLYAKNAFKRRDQEDVKIISDLDFELYTWKAGIPEITKSDQPEQDDKDTGLIWLTMLHHSYYQLIIVIHSSIFQTLNLVELEENLESIFSSVSLCVAAARATISLLSFHEDRHPFSIYLLNNVSWSLDIIFINILQNKGAISAREDLNRLGRIISLFKKYDPNYIHSMSFRIAKVFYQVAWKALQNHAFYQNPPPNDVPPPTNIPLLTAWNRHLQPKVVPNDTPTKPLLESRQVPFYNQTTAADCAFPSDQQATTAAPFNLPTDELFYDLRLDDNPSGNMAWTGQDQGGLNTEWRLSLGLDPQYWQAYGIREHYPRKKNGMEI